MQQLNNSIYRIENIQRHCSHFRLLKIEFHNDFRNDFVNSDERMNGYKKIIVFYGS